MSEFRALFDRLDQIEAKLDLLLKPKILREAGVPVSPAVIVERYKAVRHMGSIAGEFGISPQRVHQIVSAWEKSSNEKIERLKYLPPRKPRVKWICTGCGSARQLTPSAAAAQGTRCASCERAGRRKISDEDMEAIVVGLRAGGRGRWSVLAATLGYPATRAHSVQRMVFKYLERNNRVADIWPNGAPHWLRKHAAVTAGERIGRRAASTLE